VVQLPEEQDRLVLVAEDPELEPARMAWLDALMILSKSSEPHWGHLVSTVSSLPRRSSSKQSLHLRHLNS
jgi:hypothetical protein